MKSLFCDWRLGAGEDTVVFGGALGGGARGAGSVVGRGGDLIIELRASKPVSWSTSGLVREGTSDKNSRSS